MKNTIVDQTQSEGNKNAIIMAAERSGGKGFIRLYNIVWHVEIRQSWPHNQ